MKAVFPDAQIKAERLNSMPAGGIFVRIDAYVDGIDQTPIVVWSGSQRDLFGKYDRPALPEINANLQRLAAEGPNAFRTTGIGVMAPSLDISKPQ